MFFIKMTFLIICLIAALFLGVGYLAAAMIAKDSKKYFLVFSFGSFFLLALVIAALSHIQKTEVQRSQIGPEKSVAMLSYYINDNAKESETYYVEVTEKGTYKWCYFHEDGEHIVKVEAPASMVELIYQDDDLPYRMEAYLSDGKPILYQIHLPNDANTIQLDKGND